MRADFKTNKRVYVTGADSSESILIKQLIEDSKEEDKVLEINENYDIDDEVTGFSLEVKDKPTEVEGD